MKGAMVWKGKEMKEGTMDGREEEREWALLFSGGSVGVRRGDAYVR
jgi:hypothetical protein